MRSAARLAAWMPATRATASTSPLLTALLATMADVSGFMNTLARARARRWVGSLGVTSTMRALPSGSRWVRPRSDTGPVYGVLGSAADLGHRSIGADEVDLADVVAGPFGAHGPLDGGGQLAVGAEQGPQVELVDREQAGAELTLGGEADPVAALAERPGDAGDATDLAPAVEVAVAGGRLGAVHDGLEGVDGVDGGHDLVGGHNLVGAPGPVGVEGHELDEPHLHALVAA